MHQRRRLTPALALSAALGVTLVPGAPAAHADPTVMYPVTSGAAGAYGYSLAVGEGTDVVGEPAFCTAVDMTHPSDPTVSEVDGCRGTDGDKLVSGRRILKATQAFYSADEGPSLSVDSYATTRKATRLKLSWDDRRSVVLGKGDSVVVRLYGERMRIFYRAYLDSDPQSADRIVAQDKVCRKVKVRVKGKIRTVRRCSWKTVADRPYFLLP
jgi:hypothetical protein